MEYSIESSGKEMWLWDLFRDHLAQETIQWRALVNVVMVLRIPEKAINSLNN
jgi:hypothetical protein